jgi:hypothetical protein
MRGRRVGLCGNGVRKRCKSPKRQTGVTKVDVVEREPDTVYVADDAILIFDYEVSIEEVYTRIAIQFFRRHTSIVIRTDQAFGAPGKTAAYRPGPPSGMFIIKRAMRSLTPQGGFQTQSCTWHL